MIALWPTARSLITISRGTSAVATRHIARSFGRNLDSDAGLILAAGNCCAGESIAHLGLDSARDLKECFVCSNADRPDIVFGDVGAAAQQRQDPARIGVLAAADIHAEPDDIIKPGAVMQLVFAADFADAG